MSVLRLMQCKLVTLYFSYDASPKRISKLLNAFCDSINTDDNGHPLRVVSVAYQPNGHAILSVWYPTNQDEDAPITVDRVTELLKARARGLSWFDAPLRFPRATPVAGLEHPVVLEGSPLVIRFDRVLQTRKLYMHDHGLWSGQVSDTVPLKDASRSDIGELDDRVDSTSGSA